MKKKIDFEDLLKRQEDSPNKIEGKLFGELYDLLNTEKIEDDFKQPIFNYAVIRMVSIIENYFKNTVRELVDKHDLQVSGIFPKQVMVIEHHIS